MVKLARLVIAHRSWLVVGCVLFGIVGALAAPSATAELNDKSSLSAGPGHSTIQQSEKQFDSGAEIVPVLLVVGDHGQQLAPASADQLVAALTRAVPGLRIASYSHHRGLRSRDGRTGVIVVHPIPGPGADPAAAALPAIRQVAAERETKTELTVDVTDLWAFADWRTG
jgi:hypothetical protein